MRKFIPILLALLYSSAISAEFRVDSSIERALESARAHRKSNPADPITIRIPSGAYFLSTPIILTPEDSNLTLAAEDNAPVLISAGVKLSNWTKNSAGHWTTHVPEVQEGKWNFISLFADGQRRIRPRLPKTGYYNIADTLDPSSKSAGKGYDRFKYNGIDIRPDFANLTDVECLATHIWTMSRFRIEGVDDSSKTVIFTGHTRHTDAWARMPKGNRYLLENIKEALADPGQFYLDRKTGVLTYIPLPGEDPAKTEIIAPRHEKLVELRGDVKSQKWVTNITLKGITFAHTNWVTPSEGNSFAQAEINLGGAIHAVGSRNCVIEKCNVRHIATYGIELGDACQNNRIESCELTDLGAGGVKLGTTSYVKDESLVASHNTVRDCLIAHGGRTHPAAIGVWIGHSPHNTIEHNEIFDFYYTGVSMGWSWGYGPSNAHHNTIAYNHIHRIGQGVLSDMGGIYTLGLSEGSVLRHNLIHDIHAFNYGGWGIYFDEGTTRLTAEHNVVYHTKTGGFHQHYGKENTVRYNIFANSKTDQLQRTRPESHKSFTFEQNIVFYSQGQLLGSNWGDDKYTLDRNLYWRTDGQPVTFLNMKIEEWRTKKGRDHRSVIEDPLFVDPANGNYRLKDESPAWMIKFKPMDWTKVGRITKSRSPKPAPAAFPTS